LVVLSEKSYSHALTQFHVILLDDLAVTWRRNQATLCTYVMPYRKLRIWMGAKRCQKYIFGAQRTAQLKDLNWF